MSPKNSSADSGTSGSRQLNVTIVPEGPVNFVIESAEGLEVSESGLIKWTELTPAGVYITTITSSDGEYSNSHNLTLN